MRIGQDHKDSSTKSGRDPSSREAGEGVHRRDRTFQSRLTVRVPVLHRVCRPVHEFMFVDLLKAKSEALASLKKDQFLSEKFKMYCLDPGILQERTIPKTPQQNGLAERCNRTLLEMARC